jgi:hypothetical protein
MWQLKWKYHLKKTLLFNSDLIFLKMLLAKQIL